MAQLVSREERQAKINTACALLIEFGFPPELFSLDNIFGHGYKEDEFIEFVEPISSITDMRELEYLFKEARRSLHYSIPTELKKFMYCVNWLMNSEPGRKIMHALRRNRMDTFERREMSEADLELGHMLVDFVASRKQKIQQIDLEIQQLTKRQQDLEIESQRLNSESHQEFGPFWCYNEIHIPELRLQCCKLYLEDCISKGIDAIPIADLGFDHALESFGSIVKEDYVLEFLNDPTKQARFQNFFREKFVRLIVDGKDMKYSGGGNWVIADSGTSHPLKYFHKFVSEVDDWVSIGVKHKISDGISIPGVKATHCKEATVSTGTSNTEVKPAEEAVTEDEKAKKIKVTGDAEEAVTEDEKAKKITVTGDAEEAVTEDEKAKKITVTGDAEEAVTDDEKAKRITVTDDENAK